MARKKRPTTYYFKTVADMQAVPIDKLEAFTTDLRLWLELHRIADASGALKATTPTDVFAWIDDGKHDVRVNISIAKAEGQ